MKKTIILLSAFFLILACSNPKPDELSNPINVPTQQTSTTCLQTIYTDNNIPYLQNLDTQDTIKSIDFDSNQESITPLSNSEIFATDNSTSNLVVNEKYFSDLNKVDATRIEDAKLIGITTTYIQEKLTPREIFTLLIETQIIQTYWHLGATICLETEENTPENYIANYSASHEYCTNKCQSEEYTFQINLNKESGEIKIK